MMMTVLESVKESSKTLLSLQRWVSLISLFLQFTIWKEKWSGKLSNNWKPEDSSLWRESKEGRILLRWLLATTMELLTLSYCLEVNFSKKKQWGVEFFKCWFYIRQLIMWFAGKDAVLSYCWLLILSRWKYIGIRPAIASIPHVDEVWKALVIHMTVLYCIFLSSLRGWNNKTLLKYHKGNP